MIDAGMVPIRAGIDLPAADTVEAGLEAAHADRYPRCIHTEAVQGARP